MPDKLTPTKGEKKEAKVEGGETEAVKYARSTYAFRFTPEDAECEGIQIDR